MKALDPEIKLIQGSDHVATSIGDETAVMSIARGRYYAVGKVAERVWQMLEQPVSLSGIIELLTNEYDITEERCRSEVGPFVTELFEEGLVVEHRP